MSELVREREEEEEVEEVAGNGDEISRLNGDGGWLFGGKMRLLHQLVESHFGPKR